jgi:hypothetical protein
MLLRKIKQERKIRNVRKDTAILSMWLRKPLLRGWQDLNERRAQAKNVIRKRVLGRKNRKKKALKDGVSLAGPRNIKEGSEARCL